MEKAFLIIVFISCLSCTPQKSGFKDRAGNFVNFPARRGRIISGAPAVTEIVAALGAAESIVACDKYSLGIEGVPEDAAEIDFLYPDAELTLRLEPDLIIANGINKHGAGSDPFALIEANNIPVLYIPMSASIEDIYKDIAFIAEVLGREEEGEALVEKMKQEIAFFAETGGAIKHKKKVYFEIAPPPQMTALGSGTYLNEMINIIGAENIFSDTAGIIFPSEETVIMRDPDVILTNLYYLIDDPVSEMKSRPGFAEITAVKNGAVFLIDADSSSRPTQNIVKALREMALDIYPEYYDVPDDK